MKVTIDTLLDGSKVLTLDKERVGDGGVLRGIVGALGKNQYGSLSVQGRLCQVSIPIRLVPCLGMDKKSG